jgi:hypothetical protein
MLTKKEDPLFWNTILIDPLETSLKIICKEGMDKRVKDIKV